MKKSVPMWGLLKVKRSTGGCGTVRQPAPRRTRINAANEKAIRAFSPNRSKMLTKLSSRLIPAHVLRLRNRQFRRAPEYIVAAWHRRLQGAESAPFHFRAIGIEHFWTILEVRIENGLPIDSRAAIGSLATHDGRQGGIGHLFGFVQFGAVDDGIDQVHVFLHVRIDSFFPIAPHRATFAL